VKADTATENPQAAGGTSLGNGAAAARIRVVSVLVFATAGTGCLAGLGVIPNRPGVMFVHWVALLLAAAACETVFWWAGRRAGRMRAGPGVVNAAPRRPGPSRGRGA
jgi:hypothetical protein